MTLTELLEMSPPELRNTEQVVQDKGPRFISSRAMGARWDTIERGKFVTGEEFYVLLNKHADKTAVIGSPGKREDDGSDGIKIFGYVDFKKPNLSGLKSISVPTNVLQVSQAYVGEKQRAQGWGLQLYASIATKYAIISDNTQYIGGKALWKRIARATLGGKYKVFVLDHGDIRLGKDGKPVEYDGENIDDSDLWSENSDKRYTLFVLSAT